MKPPKLHTTLKEHIHFLLQERLLPIIENIGNKGAMKESQGGGTADFLNNTPVYPDGATKFPTFDKPETPEELGMLSNREYGLNTDRQSNELYLNRDTVSDTPILPGNDGMTIGDYRKGF